MPPSKRPTRKESLTTSERSAYRRLEDVVGCKWSAAVLAAIGRGVTRPGQLQRFIPGISTKVLNERLRKLVDYRLITRTDIEGNVPHTGIFSNGNRRKALCNHREHPRFGRGAR